MEYLVVCAFSFLAGLVDAVAGGGGLISLPAYLFAGLPVHMALGTNKLSNSMGTLIATIKYAREGYMVPALVALAVPLALIGSWTGGNLVLLADERVVEAIMLLVLPVVAFFVLRTKDLDKFSEQGASQRRTFATVAVIALCMGVYDGFYGPGTGTFLMLALTAIAHQDVRTAAGTTKAINLSTNLAALAVFLLNNSVLIPLGLVAGLFNIAGNWIGASEFAARGSALARPVMLVVIALFACKLVFDLFIAG